MPGFRSRFRQCFQGSNEKEPSPPPSPPTSSSSNPQQNVSNNPAAPPSYSSIATPTGRTQPQSNTAFLRALEKHKESLTSAEQRAFLKANANSPESLITQAHELDSKHLAASRMRRSAAKVDGILNGANGYISALTICTGHDPYSAIVLGGVKTVIELAIKFPGFFAKLTRMMETIFENLGYLSNYASPVFLSSVEIQDALEKTYGDLLLFCKKARRVFTDEDGEMSNWTSMKLLIKVSWAPFESEFTGLQTNFLTHAEIVVKHAQGQEFVAAKINRQLQELRYEREEALKKDERRKSILQWVSEIDFEDVHEMKYAKRHKHTGDWLLQSDEFRHFMDSTDKSSMLWCYGKPGVGKSILSSAVLNEFSARYPASDNVGIAFAYCDYRNPRVAKTYIAAFVKQLARRLKQIPVVLDNLYSTHHRDNRDPSYEELLNVLRSMLNEFEQVYIVHDALDECSVEDRSQILGLFSTLISNSGSQCKVKVFLTSRKEIDIERHLGRFHTPRIEMGPGKVEGDIRVYIEDQIEQRIQSGALQLDDPGMKHVIRDTLIKGSDWMFLWVVLQLDRICQLTSDDEIRDALQTLPRTIEDTYHRIFTKIEQQERKQSSMAFKMIQIVAYAARQLKIEELAEAMGTDSRFTRKEEIPTRKDPEQILHLGQNLIVVGLENYVRFVHYSVQEYIDAIPRDMPHLGALLDKRQADGMLTRICLTYLNFPNFNQPCNTPWDLNIRKLDNPLLSYASEYWDDHVRKLQDSGACDSAIVSKIKQLFSGPGRVESIVQVLDQEFRREWLPIPRLMPTETPPYAMAMFFNLRNICNEFERTTLTPEVVHWIICFAPSGSLELALNTAGVDINHPSNSKDHKTAIYVAAECSNFEAAQLLLSRGAAVNVLGGQYGTPLAAAAYNGNDALVKLLLENGADVGLYGGEFGSALTSALTFSDKATIKHLLNAGIDVNGPAGEYATPLQVAAHFASDEVFDLLITHGANLHTPVGGVYGTVLQAAASVGDMAKIKRLLELGADVHAAGGKYGNAMQAAARWGNVATMQLLIDHGADISGKSGNGIYGNTLQAAAHNGNLDAIKFLLERGVDPNIIGGKFGSAIQAAADYGAKDIIARLANSGGDVNLVVGECGTALQAAAYRGRIDVVMQLINLGANVNIEGCGQFGTALQAAAHCGELDVVQALLGSGARKDSGGGRYGSPLKAARAAGPDWKPPKSEEVISQLVKLLK